MLGRACSTNMFALICIQLLGLTLETFLFCLIWNLHFEGECAELIKTERGVYWLLDFREVLV